MGHDLRPYPEYKDSRLPWLGQIPAHWEVRRNGRLFAQRNETGFSDLPILEVSLKTEVRVRDFENSARKQVMSDRAKYKRAAKGDIAYNMMRLWQGAVGVAPVDGLISPAYVVARPFPEVDTRYYAYLFRTEAYMAEVNQYSRGIVSDRNRLYWDEFKQMPSVFPLPAEQTAIANFLDEHGRQVRQLIRNKRRVIELLNDQKQAVINLAVTRGLDSSVRMTDSGDSWLGEVPESWVVKPLKRWVAINARDLPESTGPGFAFRYLDIGSVGTGYLVEQPEIMRFAQAPSRARRILRNGDTIISTVRTYLKAVYFVSDEVDDLVASTGFAVLSPGPAVVPEFLSFVIQSNAFIDRVTAHSVGIAYPAIAETRLGAFHVALPPSEAEQQILLDHIKHETRELDVAIQSTRRELELIHEYRTRLISDVVKGKVDVRHLAPEAVEVTEDLEPLDEAEEFFEDELQDAADLEPVEEVVDADD